MTPTDIRKALLDAHTTAAAISRRLGVTRGAVSQVIHGRLSSQRIRAAIADAIGMSVTEVWGEPADEPGDAQGAAAGPLHMYTTEEGGR